MMARQAALIWPRLRRKTRFGGYDHLLTFPLDGLPNNLFGASTSIDISRIEKIAACIQKPGNDALGLSRRSAPLALFSKNHGSQAQGRHQQAATAQLLIVHGFHAPFSRLNYCFHTSTTHNTREGPAIAISHWYMVIFF